MIRKNKTAPGILPYLLGVVLILLLIQLGGAVKGNAFVFPDVREIGTAFRRLLGASRTYALIGTTLLHVLEALAVSMVIGILLGLAEGLSRWMHALFQPLMVLIRSMPMIILVILIMTMVSYRLVPVVAAGTVLIPLISEAVCEGCRAIDPELIDVYRLNGGFSLQVLVRVYLPMMAGFLRQAFTNAVGMGLKIAVSAEYLVQTRDSLGKAVYSSSYFNEYAEIYAYAFLMVLMVLLFTEVPIRLLKKLGNRS